MVSTLSRPPVEPLNAERGMWALKEGGVALDRLASTPIGTCPPLKSRGSGHLSSFRAGPSPSPMNLGLLLVV